MSNSIFCCAYMPLSPLLNEGETLYCFSLHSTSSKSSEYRDYFRSGRSMEFCLQNMLKLRHNNNTVTHFPVSFEGYVMTGFILCLYDKYHDKCFLHTILFTIS